MKWLIVLTLLCVPYLVLNVSYAQSDSVPDSVLNSCVKTVRWILGVDIPHIDATYYQSFPAQQPALNGLILTSYRSGADHVAVIKDFREDGFWVDEGNYVAGKRTQRLIKWNAPEIRGFWSPNYL